MVIIPPSGQREAVNFILEVHMVMVPLGQEVNMCLSLVKEPLLLTTGRRPRDHLVWEMKEILVLHRGAIIVVRYLQLKRCLEASMASRDFTPCRNLNLVAPQCMALNNWKVVEMMNLLSTKQWKATVMGG